MESLVRWRHPLSAVLTGLLCAVTLIVWRSAPSPHMALKDKEVMHVALIAPPSPPKPVPPQPVPPRPQPPKPPKRVVHRAPPKPAPVKHAKMPEPAPVETAPPQPSAPAPAAPVQTAAPPVDPAASLEAEYIAKTRAEVERVKRYPMSKDARLMRPAGTVTVVFTLGRSGKLLAATVETSAGSILDRQALVTLHWAEFPPFPPGAWPGQAQHRFRVDINFKPS